MQVLGFEESVRGSRAPFGSWLFSAPLLCVSYTTCKFWQQGNCVLPSFAAQCARVETFVFQAVCQRVKLLTEKARSSQQHVEGWVDFVYASGATDVC